MLCITNNSIMHQLFVYIQLNDQTALFQTIQLSISHLFVLFKSQTVLFDSLIGLFKVLPLQVRMNLGAMAMKGILHSPNSSITGALSSDVISRTHVLGGGGLIPQWRSSWCILIPSWMGCKNSWVCSNKWRGRGTETIKLLHGYSNTSKDQSEKTDWQDDPNRNRNEMYITLKGCATFVA